MVQEAEARITSAPLLKVAVQNRMEASNVRISHSSRNLLGVSVFPADGGQRFVEWKVSLLKLVTDEQTGLAQLVSTWTRRGVIPTSETSDDAYQSMVMEAVEEFITEFVRVNASEACVVARNNTDRRTFLAGAGVVAPDKRIDDVGSTLTPQCELLERPESYFHLPGRRPAQIMSIAASVSAGATAMGWTWSHALPNSVLYRELDFGPARRSLTAAEWFCLVDEKTSGTLRLQMYPPARHVFVGEVLEQQGDIESGL